MRYLLTVFCLALLHISANGQAVAEFEKIIAAYKSSSLSFDGHITMFSKSNPKQPLDEMAVSYRIQSGRYQCRLGPVEISGGEQFMVQVDHEQKKILIGRRQQQPGLPAMDFSALKSMVPEAAKMITLVKGDKLNKLVIRMPLGSGIKYYELEYDSRYFVQRVMMEMEPQDGAADGTLMVMAYRNFSTAAFAPCCRESDYFTVSDGKRVVLNKTYTGYKLISEL